MTSVHLEVAMRIVTSPKGSSRMVSLGVTPCLAQDPSRLPTGGSEGFVKDALGAPRLVKPGAHLASNKAPPPSWPDRPNHCCSL